MEAMSLILTAIVAGESKADSGAMVGAVEDDFASLHQALRTRLEGHPETQQALEHYIARPEAELDSVKAGLREAGATTDQRVLDLALKVMQRIDPEGSANGNYLLDRV